MSVGRERVSAGELSAAEAVEVVQSASAYEEIDQFAKIDHQRTKRTGACLLLAAACCVLLGGGNSASLCCSGWRSTLTISPFATLASSFRGQACQRWFLGSPRPHRRLYPSWRCVTICDASAPAVLSSTGCADGLCCVLLHPRRQVLAREAVRDIATRPVFRLWEVDC